jgi:hypothetical protein
MRKSRVLSLALQLVFPVFFLLWLLDVATQGPKATNYFGALLPGFLTSKLCYKLIQFKCALRYQNRRALWVAQK